MSASFYEIQEKNIRKTKILIFLFIVIASFMGFLLDYIYMDFPNSMKFPVYTFIAFVFSSVNSFISYRYGDKIVLKVMGAREPNLNDLKEKTLLNIVKEMKIASGLPQPKVYVIDSPIPNAFATGRNPENSSIAVTKGLLDMLNREELQAVIGHEMAHIRNRDILVMTISATLLGVIVILADAARRFLFYSFIGGSRRRRRTKDIKGGGPYILIALIVLLILSIIGPLIARLVFFSVSRSREYFADATSAELTRNPLGLAKALEKISKNQNPQEWRMKGISHMCIVNPLSSKLNEKEGFLANLFSTHPPINKRIQLLKQMAYIK